jgi:hypothetical protein
MARRTSGYTEPMSDRPNAAEKPTEEWVTGDEPITGPQASYLETLAREAGEEVPEGLTKAQASELIDRLQEVTGRGRQPSPGQPAASTDESGPTEFGHAVEP